MTVRAGDISGAENYVLQEAIGAYADEAYTNAKKLSGTGIVGSNPNIDTNTETFIGQARWFKPMQHVINVVSLTDSTDGTVSDFSSDYFRYIKSVRASGARKVNMQQVVTQQDGLANYGRTFGENRAQDEHDAILAVLKGVAISEALNGAAVGQGATGTGGQTFDNDPTDKKFGFYVDLGAAKPVVDATAAVQGAARAEGFVQAIGMAWKDYEADYYYLVTSPRLMSQFRSANLVDEDRVTDGSLEFSTIFQGKFRLIQTRATQKLSAAERTKLNTGAGVDIVGTECSFIIAPGALAMASLAVPDSTEITRKGAAYKGGGTTEIWNRWGYVLHPAGYDWAGGDEAFVDNAGYSAVLENGNQVALTAAANVLANTTGVWKRKATSALSLGILPVFHS